jgi:hypothetical protein
VISLDLADDRSSSVAIAAFRSSDRAAGNCTASGRHAGFQRRMRSACEDAGVGAAAPVNCHAVVRPTVATRYVAALVNAHCTPWLLARSTSSDSNASTIAITAVQANVNCHATCAPLRCTLGSPKGTLTLREIQSNRRSNPSRLLWSNAPSSTVSRATTLAAATSTAATNTPRRARPEPSQANASAGAASGIRQSRKRAGALHPPHHMPNDATTSTYGSAISATSKTRRGARRESTTSPNGTNTITGAPASTPNW